MKKILFGIIVISLTPIYLIIKFIKCAIEIITELTQPFAEEISDFVDNMIEFWEKIFKLKEEK